MGVLQMNKRDFHMFMNKHLNYTQKSEAQRYDGVYDVCEERTHLKEEKHTVCITS